MYSLDELTGNFLNATCKIVCIRYHYNYNGRADIAGIISISTVCVTIIVHGIKSKQFNHNFQLGVKISKLCSSRE